MRQISIILIMSCLLLCGCGEDKVMEAFAENDDIRLQVGGSEQFRYDPMTCQIAFNKDKKIFRALTDNASDFFIAELSAIPTELNQSITADLTWTTLTDIVSRKNLQLSVIKIDDTKLWLWSKYAKIGICIELLY